MVGGIMLVRATLFFLLLGFILAARADTTPGEAFCAEPDADPTPLHRGPPDWPHVAILMCLQGTVVVEFTVDAHGAIRDASVYDADQPGIFERAALDAVQQWVYRPGCQDGMPVDMQQRTALDFLLEDDFRRQCAAGAELLTGESLELAGSLGLLYSMLAEWFMHPHQAGLPDQIRAAMVAGFDGDLGRVERFHHRVLGELVAMFEQWLADPRPDLMQLFQMTHTSGRPAEGLPDGVLKEVRSAQADWIDANLDYKARTMDWFADLQAEVDLEPELLDVLVRPFLGDVMMETGEQGNSWLQAQELTDAVLDLLEDPDVHWTLSGFGFDFEDPEDGKRFHSLMVEFLTLYESTHADFRRAMGGFMDYQSRGLGRDGR